MLDTCLNTTNVLYMLGQRDHEGRPHQSYEFVLGSLPSVLLHLSIRAEQGVS